MQRTNEQAVALLDALYPHLGRRDLIGYVCARNVRAISDAVADYVQVRNALLSEYGGCREDGTPYITPEMDGYDEFMSRYEPIASVEQELTIMPLRYTDVVGELTGEEILDIDWMQIGRAHV